MERYYVVKVIGHFVFKIWNARQYPLKRETTLILL